MKRAARKRYGSGRKDLADLRKLRRSAFESHYRRTVGELAGHARFPRLSAFLPANFWEWIKAYLKYALRRKHAFAVYPAVGERGCYALRSARDSEPIRISIAGDWGTGTAEARRVGECIAKYRPDYTIHLGDIYYVGAPEEIRENFLGQASDGHQGVSWPKGALGSFSLNSNHEMYANGTGYFEVLLPALGIPESADKSQLASYFCLSNEHWRILGLDTGYNSVGVPVLEQIPFIGRIPGVGPSYKLESPQLDWLETVVRPRRNPRATLLLSHHQYFSAFDADCVKPAKQLLPFFADQDVIWLWGHEHRMAVYERFAESGIRAYGRCVGHGGMPVEIKPPRPGAAVPLRYCDCRGYRQLGATQVGYNGFVNILLEGSTASFEYRDLHDALILREVFEAQGSGFRQRFDFVNPELSAYAAS